MTEKSVQNFQTEECSDINTYHTLHSISAFCEHAASNIDTMMINMVSNILAIILVVNTTSVYSFVEKSLHFPTFRVTLHCSPSPLQSSSQPLDLNLLAFSTSDALFLGQSTCVTLKEGRFFDLIDDATSNHNSLIGMMLMGDDRIVIEGMPLCKIVDVDVRSGFRGRVTMSVELQAVGRARLEELKQMQPTIMGTCTELRDVVQMSKGDLKKSQSWVDRLAYHLKQPSILTVYQSAYTDAVAMLEEEYRDTELRDMAAKSWAYMACLSPESIGRYGPKAIATTAVHTRLEIVAKAFLNEQVKNTESLMSVNPDDQETASFE